MLKAQSPLGDSVGQVSHVCGFRAADALLHERADFACVLVSSAVNSEQVIEEVTSSVRCPLPAEAGPISAHKDLTAIWLNPRAWLIQCALGSEHDLVARVNSAFPDRLVYAVPYTDSLAWLELSGKGSEEILRDGGFLSLDPNGIAVGFAKRTLLAGIAVLILRRGETRWLLGTERSRCRYFSSWLCGAAEARERSSPTGLTSV